jgi:hypothetical protein
MNRINHLPPHYTVYDGGKPQIYGKSLWQAAYHQKKPLVQMGI